MTRRRLDEKGSTLLESVLVILLVSSIIMALASGLLTTAMSARKVNDSQRLSFALTSFVEAIRGLPYQAIPGTCTPETVAASYLAAYNALPADQRSATAGLNPEIISAKFWKLQYTTTTVAGFDQWSGGCADKSGAVKLRLRLTVRGSTPGGTGSNTAEVVKRAGSRQG